MTQSQTIVPCIWCDSHAEEAANFYVSLFANSRIGRILCYGNASQEIMGKPPSSVLTVDFEIAGYRLTALNGGPQFTLNPAISFFVACESAVEVEALWAKLAEGGTALMALDTYPWSEKYGWIQDRFGVNWQIMLGAFANAEQKIAPCLMFGGVAHGNAEAAINRYTQTFPDSTVHFMDRYTADEGDLADNIKHAQFELANQLFVAMDGGPSHAFTFNEGISLQIMCETQAEIDAFWAKLTAGGGEEGPCGWLKDPFGVSWQVTPIALIEMLSDPEIARTDRVTEAYLRMKKFDLAALQRAYDGEVA